MTTILFGSIGTLVETSELQREAFNRAFREHGLDWNWERDEYREMLAISGGRNRIQRFAESRGETVDADAVHATKSRIYQELLGSEGVELREGVAEIVHHAKEHQHSLGLVTTTSRENIEALLSATNGQLSLDDFDVIVDSATVGSPKPNADCYEYALKQLGDPTGEVIAIEDNVDGVQAAKAAGLLCVAFPGANTQAHDYSKSDRRVDRLETELVATGLAS